MSFSCLHSCYNKDCSALVTCEPRCNSQEPLLCRSCLHSGLALGECLGCEEYKPVLDFGPRANRCMDCAYGVRVRVVA
jgi:hypothetical protein